MLVFFLELLFPRVATVNDNTITYRTDCSNILLLTNLVQIFIIYKLFRRIRLLVEHCVANNIEPLY
jgi:hypothetical protein